MLYPGIIVKNEALKEETKTIIELKEFDLNDFMREAETATAQEALEQGWDLEDVSYKIAELDTFDDETLRGIIESIFTIVDKGYEYNESIVDYDVVMTDVRTIAETIVKDEIQKNVEKFIKTGVTPEITLERTVKIDDEPKNVLAVLYKIV